MNIYLASPLCQTTIVMDRHQSQWLPIFHLYRCMTALNCIVERSAPSMNTNWCMQIVEYYRKHLPVISKSETTFKVAFIERHHKRRIENYNELLEWCNTKLHLPPGSHFKDVECVPLNLDHADRYLQTLAEMQTVDVLVSHCLGLNDLTGVLPCCAGLFAHSIRRIASVESNLGWFVVWESLTCKMPECKCTSSIVVMFGKMSRPNSMAALQAVS